MTSLHASQPFSTSDFPSTQHNDLHHLELHMNTAQSAYPVDSDYTYSEAATLNPYTYAFLTPASDSCMYDYTQPDIKVESATPASLPLSYDTRQDSVVSAFAANASDWQHMYQAGMSTPGATTRRPLKRARTHNRTPSASTVASNGPASPYTANTSYPLIANTDYSPNSPAHYTEPGFSKALLTPQQTPTDSSFVSAGYIPSHLAHATNAHLAMKNFAIDYHNTDDYPSDFYPSSRHSMSSGHDSPATPQSNAGDVYDSRGMQLNQHDYQQTNPNVQLYRSESSRAYQDELYNPNGYTSMPFTSTKPSTGYLSPHHNLVTERLQTANLARSVSPTSAMSRERSPFRAGSPLAPAAGTVAGMRQQQKEQAAQAEYAQHVPNLQREPTKTISPKDALLDYHETDQQSLFHDQIPTGYRQHSGGTQQWDNNFVGQSGSTFGDMSAAITSAQQMNGFRATANSGWEANMDYMNLPPNNQEQSQIQAPPFPSNAFEPPRMNYTEATPQFPPQLTSMESSMSEGQPPMSSQGSFSTSTPVQRPVDTRANTGTYTCTYHGCTERFNSHNDLQRHKRDYHRSQQYNRENTSTSTPAGTDSASPRSTESPAPSESGLTSAAILARNSQAGPHKCSRINPSTNKPCNTIFSRPYDLTRHEDTIHNGRKQKVRCPMCREEKTFSRNDALTRHMRVVHPEVEAYGKRSRRE